MILEFLDEAGRPVLEIDYPDDKWTELEEISKSSGLTTEEFIILALREYLDSE